MRKKAIDALKEQRKAKKGKRRLQQQNGLQELVAHLLAIRKLALSMDPPLGKNVRIGESSSVKSMKKSTPSMKKFAPQRRMKTELNL